MPDSIPRQVVLEIQEGGSGVSAWKVLDVQDDITMVRLGAPDGGDIEFTDDFGRNQAKGGHLEIVDTRETGTPSPITFDLEIADKVRSILSQLEGKKNVRVRYLSGEYSTPTNYQKIIQFCNSRNTKIWGGVNRDLVNDFENPAEQLKRLFPQRASYREDIYPIVRSRILPTLTARSLAHIISVGYKRAAGEVPGEATNNPGDREFLFLDIGAAAGVPNVYWTADRGASAVTNAATGLTDFTGTAIAKAGANVVISGSGAGGGLAYANFELVKAGTATWTRSTNISAGTVINFVIAVNATRLYAVGQSGAVYKSEDGGMSFTSLGTAVTANHLTRLAYADDQLIWAGGASGTLVKIYKDVMSVVTVTGISTNAINALAVPHGLGRKRQLFIGAADGKVYRTFDSLATAPTWSTPLFDGQGSGAIDALAFAGYEGAVLFIVQTNGSSQSRVLKDLSGGVFANDCEILGSYTSPANSTIDAIAAPNVNVVMGVGPVNGGQGYVELIQ